MAEGRDWTRSQFEACPDCGHDSSAVADAAMPRALTDAAAAFGSFLATAPIADLRRWTRPGVWSPLEYACHTRDVIAVFDKPSGAVNVGLVAFASDSVTLGPAVCVQV